MKKLACFTFAAATALSLSACGSSNDANEVATPDNAEMPAEEAVSTVAAMPEPDTAPAATAAAVDPNAGSKAEDAAANAAAAAADFNAAGEDAEKAIDAAEKKM